MKNVKSFLTEHAEMRRRVKERVSTCRLPDNFLYPGLEVAIKHEWLISPAIFFSLHKKCWGTTGLPTRDPVEIEDLCFKWLGLAWALETGPSNIVALEIQPDLAQESLVSLTGDQWDWLETLHFTINTTWFFLFQREAGLLSLEEYSGIRYASGSILIPPACTPCGKAAYIDPDAPVLPAPNWLLNVARSI